MLKGQESTNAMFHVVGDSHFCSFSGTDSYNNAEDKMRHFKTYDLIPIQAYMIGLEEAPLAIQFFETLKTIPIDEYIILCMGEVDCRTTIARRVVKEFYSIQESVNITINHFEWGLQKILETHKNVILLSPFVMNFVIEDKIFCQAPEGVILKIIKEYDDMLFSLAKEYNLDHFSLVDTMIEKRKNKKNFIDWNHWRGSVVRGMLKNEFMERFGVDITCQL